MSGSSPAFTTEAANFCAGLCSVAGGDGPNRSGRCVSQPTIAVRTGPGHNTDTPISVFDSSSRKTSESATTPNFVTLYGACFPPSHAGNDPENLHPGGLTYESVAAAAGIGDYVEAVYAHHFDEPANSPQARAARVFELFAAQEQALAQRFVDYLLSKPQVRLIGAQTGDRRRRMPTFSFLVEGRSSKEIAEAVARDEIAIGHGHFYGYRAVEALGVENMDDGVVRVSMVHYNTLAEVDRLIAALEKIVA